MGIAAARGVTEAERQTGIPKQTIHEWTKTPEFGQLRTTAREAMGEQMWVAMQLALKAVVAGLSDPEVPLRDKAQAYATLYDRHALMTGGATSRTEARDITGTISDAELASALREAESLTTPDRTAEAPAGEAAG